VLLATLFALGLAQDPVTTPAPEATQLDEITVLGRRTTPDPFDIFRAVCLDANRLDKQSFRPDGVPRWSRVQPVAASPEAASPTESFVRRDGDLEMVLRIEEGPDAKVERTQRNVCSLTLAGPHDQQSLVRGMATALGGAGTSHHLRLEEIYPTYPGWTQLLWAAMPDRETTNWRVWIDRGERESGVLMVAQPSFYRRYSYVVTELRFTDEAERPISYIALTYITRTTDD
jgi:hypothetical protein